MNLSEVYQVGNRGSPILAAASTADSAGEREAWNLELIGRIRNLKSTILCSMSLTQFAMVEELAFLVRENIPCKHLILSLEEMLVNFLQNNTSYNGVLELEPMNPYNRLLVHRLAEIFGFSHKSIGEGEDRHLVLERCPETSIPSILVSDLLWQFGEVQSPVMFNLLKENVIPGENENARSDSSYEDGRIGYFYVHERIFAGDGDGIELMKPRPQSNPAVARRMITRALGQTNKTANQQIGLKTKDNELEEKGLEIRYVDEATSSGQEAKLSCAKHPGSQTLSKPSESTSKMPPERDAFLPVKGSQESDNQSKNFRNEHMGAAKRMFANALGIHRRDVSISSTDDRKKGNERT